MLFSLHSPPPTEFASLSLHDALPISNHVRGSLCVARADPVGDRQALSRQRRHDRECQPPPQGDVDAIRSEEHTSELQSQFHLVCRLLLEKKKNKKISN